VFSEQIHCNTSGDLSLFNIRYWDSSGSDPLKTKLSLFNIRYWDSSG